MKLSLIVGTFHKVAFGPYVFNNTALVWAVYENGDFLLHYNRDIEISLE